MATLKHLTLELPQPLGPAFIRVPLPLDAKARAWVDDQLRKNELHTKREQMARFREKLKWLPTTAAQLEVSEIEHAKGHTYHDACAIALGHRTCGCPDCSPTPFRMAAQQEVA